MKKLIALIGAVATAFGLYAATPYAVSFEANDPGVTEGVFTPPTGWTWTSTDTLNLGTYDGDGYLYPIEGAAARRSDSFKDKADQTSFLKLETGTNTLVREVGADNVFLDQLVKFTGYEEAPTLAAGTKIAVWMSGIEAEGTEGEDGYIAGETNLYVTCAKVAEGQVEPVALKLAAPGNKAWETDKWYRLTIKWIDDIYGGNGVSDPANTHARAGFIVYIDGTQVASSDAAAKSLIEYTNEMGTTAKSLMAGGQLFPAVDATNVDFASVGYQGIGSIDDIILDGQGPAFCAALNFNVAPGLGLKIVKVETEAGDEIKAPYAVVSGTGVKIYFGAADGYKVVSGKDKLVVNATITTEGQTVSSPAEGIETAEVVAQIIRQDQVAAEYAEVELDTAFAEVQDGDKIKFVKGCSAFSGKYVFPINATIDVTANGNWDIMVPGEAAELKDYVGAAPEKQITVTFTEDPDQSTFYLAGNIYGDGRVDTLVDVGGYTLLDGNLTIGNTFQAKDGAGAILRSVYIGGYDGDEVMGGSAKISLVGKGKVVTTTQLPDTAFAAAAAGYSVEETSEVIEETTWYTYALKGEAPAETGFAVIIAGVVSGTYPTLAEAVAEAPAGATIKLLSNEEVDSKCEITKNITLDLNGKTLARDNNAATLFVIKDVTLTINGETEGSTLVGRLNVGDSVYNGGVRTAHWDGALVINGGTYSVGNGQTVIHVNGDCLDAAVTINNATLTSPTDNGVQFNGKGTFAINNSTINGATAVYMKAGTLTIDKDSKINATAETWTAPVANHNGSNPTGDAIVMDSTTGYQGAISLTVAEGAQVTKVAAGAATIRETITDATDSTTVKIDAPTISGIALTEAFLAKVANGSAQLPGYVAAIGTVPYPTIAAAVAAAQNDDTIKVIADCTVADAILVDKAVTLDATGKTVTCAAMYPFFVKGGDLTITDGTFTQNVVDGIILWAKDGGKITVNGGDFSAIPDGEIAYVSTADALIKIYGGKFVMADKADGSKGDVLNVAQTLGLNKTDYIQVYGGSFSKDPAEGDDALGPTFVANGYASVKQDNGLWKVGAAIIATFKVDDAIVKAETNIVAFTPVAPTNPSKEGYTFTGWTPAVDEISKSTVFVAQFKAEETKVDPEQPIPVPAEKTPEQVAEQMNTKGIANYLKVPTVVTDAAAYTAMFAAKADGNTVIIALKPTVEAEIKAELANTATSGSMLNPDATTSEVTITARPGLFYGIKAVGDVTTIGTANGQNWVQASGDTVNVVRPTVSGNAAFFQAVCSPKAPPANN